MEDDIPEMVPANVRQKAQLVRKRVATRTEDIRSYIKENEVPKEDVQSALDRIQFRDVRRFLESAKAQNITEPNAIFDHAVMSFSLQNLPVENYRNDFVSHYKQGQLEKTIAYFESHEDDIRLMFPVMKEMAKSMLDAGEVDKDLIKGLKEMP